MTLDKNEFFQKVRLHWITAIETVGAQNVQCLEWHGTAAIREALRPFLGNSVNHAHYPSGGGQDWKIEAETFEKDCIAVHIDDRVIDVFKPAKMTLEHFKDDPEQSFILIELDSLAADPAIEEYRGSQELAEINGEPYLHRSVFDKGYIGHDEFGKEIPLPEEARLVSRWLNGKILLVAKGSMWNGIPETYDGSHDGMTAKEIRGVIENWISKQKS